MAPVFEGCYSVVDLVDGRVSLWHVALANDAIAVRARNVRRAGLRR